MTSRYVPYATTPARLLAQLISDLVVIAWTAVWVLVGRRKWTAFAVAATPAGEQLLALRALADRALRRLAAVSVDPVGAWRREDPTVIRGLAALELRAAGVRPRRR